MIGFERWLLSERGLGTHAVTWHRYVRDKGPEVHIKEFPSMRDAERHFDDVLGMRDTALVQLYRIGQDGKMIGDPVREKEGPGLEAWMNDVTAAPRTAE